MLAQDDVLRVSLRRGALGGDGGGGWGHRAVDVLSGEAQPALFGPVVNHSVLLTAFQSVVSAHGTSFIQDAAD